MGVFMLGHVGLIAVVAFLAAAPFPAAAQPVTSLTDGRSVYDWSGFYIGHQFGWGWSDQHVEDNTGLDGEVGLNGGFFGPIAGFQKQWNNVVVGAEVEVNWSDIDGQDTLPGAPGRTFGNIEIFGSAGVKVGYAWDRFLLYGTAGIQAPKREARRESGRRLRKTMTRRSAGWRAPASTMP